MKILFCSVHDSAVGFMTPQPYVNDKLALRSFIAACRDEKPNVVNQNPHEMTFWKVGEFDDMTGEFVSIKEKIAEAVSYVHEVDK